MDELYDLPLGLRTDVLTAPAGQIRRRHAGGYTVVRTPDFDTYYFGNVLRLPAPPAPAELPAVLEVWQAAFADAPGVSKTVLQWEVPQEAVEDPDLLGAAEKFGLEPEGDHVRVLGTLAPAQPRLHLQPRIVESDADWELAIEIATEGLPSRQQAFHRWRRGEHRKLAEAGRGQWWLGEAAGQAVTSAGIFWTSDGTLARFQSVDTRSSARGNGFASALLTAITQDLLQRLPQLATCVIVSEVGTQADRIYQRLGYQPVSRIRALWGDRISAGR